MEQASIDPARPHSNVPEVPPAELLRHRFRRHHYTTAWGMKAPQNLPAEAQHSGKAKALRCIFGETGVKAGREFDRFTQAYGAGCPAERTLSRDVDRIRREPLD